MNMRNPKWATLLSAMLLSSGVAAQTLTLTGPDGQTLQVAQDPLQNIGTIAPVGSTLSASSERTPVVRTVPNTANSANAERSASTRTVRSNETLWRIANELRPDDGVSVYQVMFALFQANPHAFSEDNFNSLERNMVLTVPSRLTMASIPADAARARAINDDKTWRGGSAAASTPANNSGGNASELEKLKAENARLTAQLAELSQTNAALEQSLAQQGDQPEGQTEADPEQIEMLRSELDNSMSELTLTLEQNEMFKRRVDELSAENGQLQTALTEQQGLNRQLEQQLNEKAEPEPLPPPPPPSFWQTLANNVWLLLLIGLVPALLVGLVAWLLIRRKKKALAIDEPPMAAPSEAVAAPFSSDPPFSEQPLRGSEPLSDKLESNLDEGLSLEDLLAAHEKQVGKDSFDPKMFDDADIEALLSDSETKPRSEPVKAAPKPAPAQPQAVPEARSEPKVSSADKDDPFIDIESLLDDSNINKTGADERYDSGSQSTGSSYVEDESTVNAKLDLARAYIEIADFDSAKALLKEVIASGNSTQQAEAEKLIAKL